MVGWLRAASFGFALKRARRSVSSATAGQHLDCDLAFQVRVGRLIHNAHSTFAKLGKDLIGPKNPTNHWPVLSMASVDPP